MDITASDDDISLPFHVPAAQVGTQQDVRSKKRCLQNLSKLLMLGFEDTEINHHDSDEFGELDIFDALFERELLGSTAIGKGCAIPHGQIPGIKSPKIAILTLSEPQDFDANDGQPIDILIGLVVPKKASEAACERRGRWLRLITVFLDKEENRQYIRQEMVPANLAQFVHDRLLHLYQDSLLEQTV